MAPRIASVSMRGIIMRGRSQPEFRIIPAGERLFLWVSGYRCIFGHYSCVAITEGRGVRKSTTQLGTIAIL